MGKGGWRFAGLVASHIVAGAFFILAILQFAPPGPVTSAVILAGIGLLILEIARRFLSPTSENLPTRSMLLAACWAAAGAAIVAGIAQVTPVGPAREFVIYFGIGTILALLSWRFLSVRPAPIEPDDPDSIDKLRTRDAKYTQRFLLALSYAGAVGLVLYSIHAVVPAGPVDILFRNLGAGVLIAAASLTGGALIGFLFGIPRATVQPDQAPPAVAAGGNSTSATPAAPTAQHPFFQINTNLEQISDWLTKIIVGLGLINLQKAPTYMQRLAYYFGAGFGDKIQGRESIALALILLFAFCGFLLGYLLTRLFLTGALARAESPIEKVQKIVDAVGKTPAAAPGAPVAEATSVDPRQIAAAQRVSEVATGADIRPLQNQIYNLAHEYDDKYSKMAFSGERTRLLDSIVAKMRVLHGPTYGILPQLTEGKSAGERVAAIAFLQMRPNPDYLDWLAERFTKDPDKRERPFIWYHAALALRAAAETLGPEYKSKIKEAIQKAKDGLPAGETATLGILDAAEKALED